MSPKSTEAEGESPWTLISGTLISGTLISGTLGR